MAFAEYLGSELEAFLRAEVQKWQKVVKETGAQVS
jgi:tripartite-type tricarboxylate transporter receptor subunit TctC